MNLYTHCKSCKKDIKIKSSASTRPDLQMEKGDEFNVNCQNCGNLEKKHVNDVKAEPNNKVILVRSWNRNFGNNRFVDLFWINRNNTSNYSSTILATAKKCGERIQFIFN